LHRWADGSRPSTPKPACSDFGESMGAGHSPSVPPRRPPIRPPLPPRARSPAFARGWPITAWPRNCIAAPGSGHAACGSMSKPDSGSVAIALWPEARQVSQPPRPPRPPVPILLDPRRRETATSLPQSPRILAARRRHVELWIVRTRATPPPAPNRPANSRRRVTGLVRRLSIQ